jgi:hypothetical protein
MPAECSAPRRKDQMNERNAICPSPPGRTPVGSFVICQGLPVREAPALDLRPADKGGHGNRRFVHTDDTKSNLPPTEDSRQAG